MIGVVEAAFTGITTDEEIRARFSLHRGGPNPYYKCSVCSQTEPGVRNCLTDHMQRCPPSQAGENDPYLQTR